MRDFTIIEHLYTLQLQRTVSSGGYHCFAGARYHTKHAMTHI